MNPYLKNVGLVLLVLLTLIPRCENKPKQEVKKVYTPLTYLNKHPVVRLENTVHTYCSGTVVSDSLVVTALHCVEPFIKNNVSVFVSDKNKTVLIETKVVFYLPYLDQALLKGDFKGFDKMKMKNPQNGIEHSKGPFVTMGYPNGGELIQFDWVLIGGDGFFLKGTGYLYKTMSGGPLVDLSTNEIVGVNSAVTYDGKAIISPIVNLITN